MTPKPHEISVPVTMAETLDDATNIARAKATKFFGAENAGKFRYQCKGGIEHNRYFAGEVIVTFDQYGENNNKEEQHDK